MRGLHAGLLAGLCAAAVHAEPLADVWPYQAKRTPQGGWEYRYELAPVKAAFADAADARLAHGDEKVKAFLAGLPKEAVVVTKPGIPLVVGAGRALEPLAMSPTFSQVNDGPLASSNPLAKPASPKLRPPLALDEPKLLLSADALALATQNAMAQAIAGTVAQTEALHEAVWSAVLQALLKAHPSRGGDAVEGSTHAIARLSIAGSCLEAAKRKPLPPNEALLKATADADFARFSTDAELVSAKAREGCAGVRRRILGAAFHPSRGDAATALVVAATLEADPKLLAKHQALVARRRLLEGGPAEEPLFAWVKKGGMSARAALDEPAAFLAQAGTEVPELFARAPGLVERFALELEPAVRTQLVDELVAAAQDGRLSVDFEGKTSAAVAADEAWLGLALGDGASGVAFERAWRSRLAALFTTLHGLAREPEAEGREPPAKVDGRSELTVRLMVPPVLDVEPVPAGYQKAAESLQALAAALTEAKVAGAAGPLVRWASILRGLAKLSATVGPPAASEADLVAARKFLAGWRAEPALQADVRRDQVSPLAVGGVRQHTATLGVGRRELVVLFAQAPEFAPLDAGLKAAASEQRYLVPVVVIEGEAAAAERPAMSPEAVRAVVDGAQRHPVGAGDAFRAALRGQ